jgi:hypothetical protein
LQSCVVACATIFDSPHLAESDRERFQPGFKKTTNPPVLAPEGIPRVPTKSSGNDHVIEWRSSLSIVVVQFAGADAAITLGPQNPIEKSRSGPASAAA